MWWYMNQGFNWWMVVGGLGMVVFWGAVIALVVWGVRRATGCCSPVMKQHPLDVTKERYAKGEITREQFEQIKKDLS